jgi:hypothetical protein
MSDRPPIGLQLPTITPMAPFVQESFDLNRLDGFVASLGVDMAHYKAQPSPIGKNDRGDYRRSDGVDTISSNGQIYIKAGVFTAAVTDNSRNRKSAPEGNVNPAEARLVMQRFYNNGQGQDNGNRVRLMPGDRLYFNDPQADCLVTNAQMLDYQPDISTGDEPTFPIVQMDGVIVDSRNMTYSCGVDFQINSFGNIAWLPTGRNPGIDPNTGKGRVYSIRYLYKAYYYVMALPKEIRITNVTVGGVRAPQRMPMHAIIMREYLFHNQARGDKLNQNKPLDPQRAGAAPVEPANYGKNEINVDMQNFYDAEKDGEQDTDLE